MGIIKISDYIKREVRKNDHKKYLEIDMILDEISQSKDIKSFTYDKNYLTVQVGVNYYYRIRLKGGE